MADYDLGNAHGRVTIDSDTTGLDRANTSLNQTRESAMGTEQAFSKTAGVMAAGGAVIAGGLAVAVGTAMDFEQQLQQIKAVSGATAPEMDKIRDAALRIGADTSFSASEAALAMEELSKSGLTTTEILNGAADATVGLAAAGQVELPAAATIMSNAMNQFSIGAEHAADVADIMAGAANASAVGVLDVGEALGQVGPAASAVGLSFQDTITAISELGNVGITGSAAGTALQGVLLGLQNQSGPAQEALAQLGIITEDGANQFYDAEGRIKSFAEVQQILQDSTANLTDAQKQQALETIFGREALVAATTFAKEGAAGFNELNEIVGNTSSQEVAATRLDSLAGVVDGLKGSAETLAINLGAVLVPTLRTIAEAITPIINKFNELSPETQETVVQVLAITAGVLLLGAGLIKTVQAIQTTMQVLQSLRILSSATQSSFIVTAAKAVWSWATIAASAVANAARTVAAWALAATQTAAHWARMAVYATVNAAKTAAAWVITNGAAAARAVAQMAVAVATTVAGWVVMAATAVMNAIIIAAQWFIALGPIGWAIAALIALVAFVIIFWDDIKAAFQAAGAWIAAKLTELWNKVVEIWNNIIGWFRQVPGWIGGVFSGAASWLVDKGRAILDGLWNGIKNVWTSVTGWLAQIGGWITNALSGAAQWLVTAGGNVVRGLWNGIQGMASWLWNKVTSWASGIVDSVLGALGINSPSIHMIYAGEMLMRGLAGGIDNDASRAVGAAKDAATAVVDTLQSNLGSAMLTAQIGTSLTDGMVGALTGTSGSTPILGATVGAAAWDPASAAAAANYGPAAGGQAGASTTINLNTFNPVAEKASDSEARKIRAAAAVGSF